MLQQTQNIRYLPVLLALFFTGICSGLLSGQPVLQVSGSIARGNVKIVANDHLEPAPPPVGIQIFEEDDCKYGMLTAGLWGNDYAADCFRHVVERGNVPKPHEVSCYVGNRIRVNGDNSKTVTIRWKNTGAAYARTDGHNASIHTDQDFSIEMAVGGLPVGTAVTVWWRYDIFAGGSTSHEDTNLNEDPISVKNAMTINGVPAFANQFDFASPGGVPGWNEWLGVSGSLTVQVGANFTFDASSIIDLVLAEPAAPDNGLFPKDQCDGIFRGEIVFSLEPIAPPTPHTGVGMLPLFSVDIGSDAELSDPRFNGNERLDPGDLYAASPVSPSPATPFNGFRDDYSIFGAQDPPPTPLTPGPTAPIGSGVPIDQLQVLFFDLDGSDLLATSLATLAYGPGLASVPFFADPCLHEAEYLYVSFDDDQPDNYASQPASVPFVDFSPLQNTVYSDLSAQNEVQEFHFDAFPPAAGTFMGATYSETDLHTALWPNPQGNNAADDDVDALDMVPFDSATLTTPCSSWYFSADHEATSQYSSSSMAIFINPATIYEATPNGPLAVVTSLHHGLPQGTDMGDFEFVWLWDHQVNRYGLALLFSVKADDPATPDDESGGLDPATLYYSFLNGTHHAYSASPLADHIDALAVWPHSLNGTLVSARPSPARQSDLVQVSPNPSASTFRLVPRESTRALTYTLIDISGRTIMRLTSSEEVAFGESLEAGLYLLHVSGKDASQVLKLLKSR